MVANLNTISNNVGIYNAAVAASSTAVIYPVANQTAMLALVANIGDTATRSDNNLSYILSATPASTLSNWTQLGFPIDSVPMLNGVATPTSGGMSGGPIIDHVHTNLVLLNNTTASYTAAEQSKLAAIDIGATANSTDIFLLSRANHTGTQLASTISDFQSTVSANALVAGSVQVSDKGIANGVATLDATGVIPTAQLPAIAITNTYVVASQTAMLALTAQVGDIAVRTDLNTSYILATTGASTLANWQEILTPTDNILSVNSQTGTVVLSTADISESTNLYYTDARVSANASVVANTVHTNTTGNPHNATTSNIAEGANLYYTESRVSANTTVTSNAAHVVATGNPHGTNSGQITEGSNLYYTETRVSANTSVVANTAHAAATGNPHGATTDNVSEGVTNLYYTDLRVTNNSNVTLNTSARHTHANSAVLNGITASYTTSNQTKLNGIATGATSNSSDATLFSRANHTGTQLASTISDFQAAVQLSDRPISTNSQAIAGIDNASDMSPLRVEEALKNSTHSIVMALAMF